MEEGPAANVEAGEQLGEVVSLPDTGTEKQTDKTVPAVPAKAAGVIQQDMTPP